ncbi:DUF2213 domain-containing protein [Erythrobacter sp. SCSIO 43205]|uniref:DUF2213 domain-containing protein n=1 Tax=Erythrobacter sp. SCSIO 43205 TaxID=2779361 RepID=UPI001CA83C11|nr:DUF2213 domain-containing protein [Erythrobacter sp. SCSIO 43205]UAB76968.1 DUF2213 domain-containing protein [Erythrobacter sp. SCSIO 43205]
MFCADHLTLDAPKRTRDGFLKVRARAARTGIYDYAGHEVDPENKHGLRDKATVKVYRPGDEVFDRASLASFVGKPITDNHPESPVNRDNWRDHARGTIMGAVRDGEYVAFDLMLTDGATIDAVEAGKRELSNGYATDLKFEPGLAPDGTAYDAVQTSITGNHIALVDRGRAGSDCRISDRFAVCDANPASVAELSNDKGKAMKKITLDGLQVDLSDADAVSAAFDKLTAKVEGAEKALTDANAAHDKALAAKDAEIDDLKSKVVDQAAIDALADAKADVVAKAKAVCGDKLGDTAGKTVTEVRRMALDAAKIDCTDKSDDYVEARFDALTADAKPQVEGFAPKAAVNDSANAVQSLRLNRYA